jgi:NAD(P)-dependent dehydrogenase (short-subunit alcohol dehydrogenase family)
MGNILDKFKLDGQAAIVTGGAGLLGREFCHTLAQAGAQVIVADKQENAAREVAEEIKSAGFMAQAVEVDVTSRDSTRTMVDQTVKMFGRLDILVCSAALDPKFEPQHAGQHGNTFEEFSLEAWQQALDVNLTGLFLSCQAAVRPMKDQDHGSIILICSTYGLVGPDQRIYEHPGEGRQYKPVYYSVTKAGVLGLTRYLSTYYAGTQIRINALTPGGVYNQHDELFVRN